MLTALVAVVPLGLSLVASAPTPQDVSARAPTELSLVFFHDRRGELDPCG